MIRTFYSVLVLLCLFITLGFSNDVSAQAAIGQTIAYVDSPVGTLPVLSQNRVIKHNMASDKKAAIACTPGLIASYYNNKSLLGSPVSEQLNATVNYD
ncbi:MAG: hypothetical protein WBA17_12515, partial [Saprospiraceae bacterium]